MARKYSFAVFALLSLVFAHSACADLAHRTAVKLATESTERSRAKHHHAAAVDGRQLAELPTEYNDAHTERNITNKFAAARSAKTSLKHHRRHSGNSTGNDASRRNLAQSCVGHFSCGNDEYCDDNNQCYACFWCNLLDDAYNGVCPSQCQTSTQPYCSTHSSCDNDEYCDDNNECWSCSTCFVFDDSITGSCPSQCTNPYAQCSSHSSCDSDEYCDDNNECWACGWCDFFGDSITGSCPSKCTSYTASSCFSHNSCSSSQYCDAYLECDSCSNCAIFRDAFDGTCPSKCGSSSSPPPRSPPPRSPPPPPSPPPAGWSLQNGDSLTLSSNTCSAGYTQCQAVCAQGYSVTKSGAAYTLTPTASQASLPSGCSCYTLSGTPINGVATGSITGVGSVTVTEISSTTYKVYISSGSCTLMYTRSTGAPLGSTSGASHLSRTFLFAALIAGALMLC